MLSFTRIKHIGWFISLLLCYTCYSCGQIWLFVLKTQEPEFSEMLTKKGSGWIGAHLFLMLALVLMIPAYFAIKHYLKPNKRQYWIDLSIFFIGLWAFTFFGQFTIDLCLVEIFRLPPETAYKILDSIQANPLIKAIFYDNSKILIVFKYIDLWMMAQICLFIALVISRKVPAWVLVLFFITLLLSTFGILLHPVYGRIIKRASYTLFSISFLPVAINILSNKNNSTTR